MRARLIKESIGEEQKFLNDQLRQINEITNEEDLRERLKEMSCGGHFPLNPQEPLRSMIKNKILKLDVKDKFLIGMAKLLGEEWRDMSPPPGAVH